MPPLPVWFTGRDAMTRFLARRAFAGAGDMVLVPTAPTGSPLLRSTGALQTGSCEHIRYMSWTLVRAGSPH
jgi:hypothetical protein